MPLYDVKGFCLLVWARARSRGERRADRGALRAQSGKQMRLVADSKDNEQEPEALCEMLLSATYFGSDMEMCLVHIHFTVKK